MATVWRALAVVFECCRCCWVARACLPWEGCTARSNICVLTRLTTNAPLLSCLWQDIETQEKSGETPGCSAGAIPSSSMLTGSGPTGRSGAAALPALPAAPAGPSNLGRPVGAPQREASGREGTNSGRPSAGTARPSSSAMSGEQRLWQSHVDKLVGVVLAGACLEVCLLVFALLPLPVCLPPACSAFHTNPMIPGRALQASTAECRAAAAPRRPQAWRALAPQQLAPLPAAERS